MKDFLISIIIPAYRTEKYVEECIHSAIEQDYPNVEIILVDDGSPDRCPEILDAFATKYDRVKVIHQTNQGLGIARDTGLLAARGEYVFFMDSDDSLDGRRAIRCLAEKAMETDADIVMGNFRKIMGDQTFDINVHHLRDGEYTRTANFRFEGFYRYGHLAYNWGKLYRREFLIKNDLMIRPYPFTQDKAHNMLCYAYVPKYAFVEESVYRYRVNDDSVTFRYKENLVPVWISIATDFHQILKERGIEDIYGDITAFHVFFGSFFIVKQELAAGKGIRKAAKAIREYGENPFVAHAMGKLAKGQYVNEISSYQWKVVIRTAAFLFSLHGYFIFTVGIYLLRGLHIDGIISGKRNKTVRKTKNGRGRRVNMNIKAEVECLCECIRTALAGNKLDEYALERLSRINPDEMADLAERHRVASMIFGLFETNEVPISQKAMEIIRKSTEKTVRQSYRLLFLTRSIVNSLEREGISVIVLKGCGVASYYPIPEYRKSGDVDLLFEDMEQAEKAGKILEKFHYSLSAEQHANHHLVYIGPEGIDIELHVMLAEPFDNEGINQTMEELLPLCFREKQRTSVLGVSIPTAPYELQALELLLHMLQHFLRSGFGLKLLTDWVVFWNQVGEGQAAEKFRQLAVQCNVSGFAEAVTLVCEKYLGLREGIVCGKDLESRFPKGYAGQFLNDIVSAEEFGKADKNRMVALRKRGILAYAKEFHYQMRMNYAEESKEKWKWPYLWAKTFITFLRNNRKLGRGSLRSILKNAGERAGVVEKMHLFQR